MKKNYIALKNYKQEFSNILKVKEDDPLLNMDGITFTSQLFNLGNFKDQI